MRKHFDIRIFGFVQGVFFRVLAKERADEFGIFGFARNEPDGTVYIEVEGEEGALQKFSEWCKAGPEPAEVRSVKIEEGAIKNFTEFITN